MCRQDELRPLLALHVVLAVVLLEALPFCHPPLARTGAAGAAGAAGAPGA